MAKNDSPPPFFETDRNKNYFLATLPIHPEFNNPQKEKGQVENKTGDKSTVLQRDKSAEKTGGKLTVLQEDKSSVKQEDNIVLVRDKSTDKTGGKSENKSLVTLKMCLIPQRREDILKQSDW